MDDPKSWFKRTEGKFGTAVTLAMLGGGAAAVLYFWGVILPWLIMMVSGTLTLIALCAIIATIGVVIFDPKWRNLISYGYKSAMRGLTGLFIEIDPIGILKTYVSNLRSRLEEMDQSIANLVGQLGKLKIQIEKNEANRVHSLKLAGEAQKHGNDMRNTFVLQSRQAGRLGKSNMTLQNLFDRMSNLLRVLKKMRDASALLVDDIQGEVEVKTAERAALLAGYGAFSKAKKIMQGGGDEREMFDMTMEKLADDYGLKMGEIESFMDMSKSVIDGVDLDNGIYEADALASLEAWEQKSQNLLLSNPPLAVRVDTQPTTRVATEADPSSFDDLFQASTEDKSAQQRR
jgi:hypothetical protein